MFKFVPLPNDSNAMKNFLIRITKGEAMMRRILERRVQLNHNLDHSQYLILKLLKRYSTLQKYLQKLCLRNSNSLTYLEHGCVSSYRTNNTCRILGKEDHNLHIFSKNKC